MKLSFALAVPLALLVGILAVSYVTLPMFNPPDAALNEQIDAEVEKAQRLLASYNPRVPLLVQAFETASTRPAGEIDPEQWRSYLSAEAEGSPFASLQEGWRRESQALSAMAQEYSTLSGTSVVPEGMPGAAEGFRRVQEGLFRYSQAVDKAISIVQGAIQMQEGEASGSSHPAATRLKAILILQKADLLRRQAALHRAAANAERGRVDTLMSAVVELDGQIKAQQTLIEGGTAEVEESAPPPPAAEQPEPVEKPAAKPRRGWIFGKALESAGLKKPKPEEAAPAPEPVESVPEPAPVEAPKITRTEQIPSLHTRTEQLQQDREEVVARIDAAQANAARLQSRIDDIAQRLTAAQQQARTTEQKMMAAEEKGVDVADPASVQPFIEEYRKLSEAHRTALREAATLQYGALRNAKPATTDIDKVLAVPLVPVDASKPIEPERGLDALQTDLALLKGAVDANYKGAIDAQKAVLAEIDQQLAHLKQRMSTVQARIERLKQDRQKLAVEVSRHAAAAIEAVRQANMLETEAIELADGNGLRAVQQAQSAARQSQDQIATFVRSENPAETPDRKLSDMASDQFTTANVTAVEGDMHYLIARTHAQRANDLALHEKMLRSLASAGLLEQVIAAAKPAEGAEPAAEEPSPASVEPAESVVASAAPAESAPVPQETADAASEPAAEPAQTSAEAVEPPAAEPQEEQPPEELPASTVVASATQTDAAAKVAAADQAAARVSALAALQAYDTAANQLKNLWVVHASIASVHRMLASLPGAAGDTEDHAKLAREVYQRAIQGREQRPEYPVYRRAIDSLQAASK